MCYNTQTIVGDKMNLRINKQFFKENKKTIFSLCYAAICTPILASCSFHNLANLITVKYYEEKYNVSSLTDIPFYTNYLDNEYYIEQLMELKLASVDLHKTESLAFLTYAKELEKLEIVNAQELTDDNIEYINQSNIKKIYFSFDQNVILAHATERLDLNKFIHKECIYGAEIIDYKYPKEEIGPFILSNYLLNTEGTHLDFSKYNDINKKLDIIIDNLKLNSRMDDSRNLAKIINYIIDHIYYDPDVSEYLKITKWHKNPLKWLKGHNASWQYNMQPLSSVLNDVNNKESGICINYSSLLLALCYKTNFSKVYMVYDMFHAWNVISYEGDPTVIDLTFFDNNGPGLLALKNYLNNDCYSNWLEVEKNLLWQSCDEEYKVSKHYSESSNINDYYYDMIYYYEGTQLKDSILSFNEFYQLLLRFYTIISIGAILIKYEPYENTFRNKLKKKNKD